VKGYRLGRYRGIGKFAFALAFAGSILSLVVAWYIHIGSPVDRRALPYVLIGGPGTFVAAAILLLLLRAWLRSCIQPNSGFPREPRVPQGTPPALILDEATQSLRPAKPASTPTDDFLDFQLGRDTLPACCCGCLQRGTTDDGYLVQVTKLLQLKIPQCADCAGKVKRELRRIALMLIVPGLLVSVAVAWAMAQASVHVSVIIMTWLVLFFAAVIVTGIVAIARTEPVTVLSRDPSRGVVRLRFRNPDYVQVVREQLS
jgi:hypothetical protein